MDGRLVVIYYIGDYDPAGVLINVTLERELRQRRALQITATGSTTSGRVGERRARP